MVKMAIKKKNVKTLLGPLLNALWTEYFCSPAIGAGTHLVPCECHALFSLTLSDGSFLEHGWLPLKHVLISTHADGKLRSAEDAQNPLCVVPPSPILYPMHTCCLLLPGLPASCPQLREPSELYLNGLVCNLAQGYKLRQLQNFLGLFPFSQDSCHSLHGICCIRKPLFHILSFSFFSFLFLEERWGTSLVIQWLRICLEMQGTQIWSLVRELRSHMPWSD